MFRVVKGVESSGQRGFKEGTPTHGASFTANNLQVSISFDLFECLPGSDQPLPHVVKVNWLSFKRWPKEFLQFTSATDLSS